MKALLLAAGLGTRLKPLTDHCPKCLMPLNGKPLLGYWLDALQEADFIDEICINLHYLSDQVEAFIKALPQTKPIRLIHEPHLLGTGGTVKANGAWLATYPFMLIHADNFSSVALDDFIAAHHRRPQQCRITMLTFRTDTPHSCGIIRMNDAGIITDFYEKSAEDHGNVANGAVYICEAEVLNFVKTLPSDHISFSDEVIPHFIEKIFTYHLDDYHIDIGTTESYRQADYLARSLPRRH